MCLYLLRGNSEKAERHSEYIIIEGLNVMKESFSCRVKRMFEELSEVS